MSEYKYRLSDEEIARYHELGYLVPSYRLPAHRLASLSEALEQVIAANPEVRPEQLAAVFARLAVEHRERQHVGRMGVAAVGARELRHASVVYEADPELGIKEAQDA